MFNLQSKSLRTIFYFYQGCALAEPGGPWRLTFALRQQEHLRFKGTVSRNSAKLGNY